MHNNLLFANLILTVRWVEKKALFAIAKFSLECVFLKALKHESLLKIHIAIIAKNISLILVL